MSRTISTRVSTQEYIQLLKKVEKRNITISDFLLMKLFDDDPPKAAPAPKVDEGKYKKEIATLKKEITELKKKPKVAPAPKVDEGKYKKEIATLKKEITELKNRSKADVKKYREEIISLKEIARSYKSRIDKGNKTIKDYDIRLGSNLINRGEDFKI